MTPKDPKIVHEFEQSTAMLLNVAEMLARYREKLEQEGFTREESLQLCLSFQSHLLRTQGDT